MRLPARAASLCAMDPSERPFRDWRFERRGQAHGWRDGQRLWANLEGRTTLQRRGALALLLLVVLALGAALLLERQPSPQAQALLGEPVHSAVQLQGLAGQLLVGDSGRAVLDLARPAREDYSVTLSEGGEARLAGDVARGQRLLLLTLRARTGERLELRAGKGLVASARL